jgi:pyrroline-5-carboxylate reductase
MKMDNELRLTIIGLGNLMEAIFPSMAEVLWGKGLFTRVNATTAEMAQVESKERHFGIKVILKDNLKALKEMEPDIIFFAPPPGVAPEIIQSELREYFSYIRQKSGVVPEIYAFPPVPPGSFYNSILGDEVYVANIIPNTVRAIQGKPLKGEGVSICTFSTQWPEERVERLNRMLSPLGRVIGLKPGELIPFLAAGVMAHVLPELVLDLDAKLREKGDRTGHQVLANYMRARFQEHSGFRLLETDPCSTDSVERSLKPLLDGITLGWNDALVQYCVEAGFTRERTSEILNAMMDHQLHIIQGEGRERIERNIRLETTKGGVLEKGIRSFHEFIAPLLSAAVGNTGAVKPGEFRQAIADEVRRSAHLVRRHGEGLAGRRDKGKG